MLPGSITIRRRRNKMDFLEKGEEEEKKGEESVWEELVGRVVDRGENNKKNKRDEERDREREK